jgi:hypothetical protein
MGSAVETPIPVSAGWGFLLKVAITRHSVQKRTLDALDDGYSVSYHA